MRIGYDGTTVPGHSGIATYGREIIMGIDDLGEGHDLRLLTSFGRGEQLREIFGDRRNIVPEERFPHQLMLGEMGMPLMNLLRERIWRRRSRDLDVAHQTNPFFFPAGARNAVVTVHDLIPLSGSEHVEPAIARLFRSSLKKIRRFARLVFVPTNFVRDELLRLDSSLAERTRVVYEGVSSDFRPIPRQPEVLTRLGIPDVPYFLYVGRIEGRKNLGRTIAAYRLLPEAVRTETALVLVANGKPGEIQSLRSTIAAERGRGTIVHLSGVSQGDLVRLYGGALGFVFPSLDEGFGLPMVEAMACGCPVVASDRSCLPEVAGSAALLVDPMSAEAIAEAMRSLAEDTALADEMRARGYARAAGFTWQRAARETLAGYGDATAG